MKYVTSSETAADCSNVFGIHSFNFTKYNVLIEEKLGQCSKTNRHPHANEEHNKDPVLASAASLHEEFFFQSPQNI